MKKLSSIALIVLLAMFIGVPALFAQIPDEGSITGTVSVQDGDETIENAMVKAYGVDGPHWPVATTRSDETGSYELTVPYGDYYVEAHAMDFLPEWWQEVPHREEATAVTVGEESNPDGINFTLAAISDEFGSIAGMVTESGSDVPIADAIVGLHRIGDWHFHRMVFTGEDGAYMFDDLPPGAYELNCGKEGYLPAEYPEPVEVNGDDITGINFALEPLVFGSISGTVTDAATDEPVGGARITVHQQQHPYFVGEAISNEDGTYQVENVFPGEFEVRCCKEGYLMQEYPSLVVVNGDDVTGIDFALEALVFGGIAGIISDAGTGDPVEGAFVIAIGDGFPFHHRWDITNENGEYLLELLAGEYYLQVWAWGYLPYENTEPIVVEGEIIDGVNMALTALEFGSIAGTVYDVDSVAIADALVEIRMNHGHFRRHVRTDENGDYLFDQVYPGTYQVRAFAYGYEHQTYGEEVVVENGGAVTGIDFYLEVFEPPYDGFISGIVTDEDTGEPIAGARLVAIGSGGFHPWHRVRHTHTAEDGSYIFNYLPDNDYKILCLAGDYNGEFYDNKFSWHEADLVTPDAENINFALTPADYGPRVMSGRVTEQDLPVDGAVVLAMRDDEIIRVTASYPDGYYYLENVEPGDYTIRVIGSSESEGMLDVSAVLEDVYDADVILSPTSVDDAISLPISTALAQNYPNPFNASTSISFNLVNSGEVDLSVYDLLGRKVVTLVTADLPAGSHSYIWNGLDNTGQQVSSGLYLYVLKTADKTYSNQMMLLK